MVVPSGIRLEVRCLQKNMYLHVLHLLRSQRSFARSNLHACFHLDSMSHAIDGSVPEARVVLFVQVLSQSAEGGSTKPPIVFLHGSYHAAWCVESAREESPYEVTLAPVTPTLMKACAGHVE